MPRIGFAVHTQRSLYSSATAPVAAAAATAAVVVVVADAYIGWIRAHQKRLLFRCSPVCRSSVFGQRHGKVVFVRDACVVVSRDGFQRVCRVYLRVPFGLAVESLRHSAPLTVFE